MADGHYVYLASDNGLTKENRAGQFQCNLPQELELGDDWYVSHVELSFVHSLETISSYVEQPDRAIFLDVGGTLVSIRVEPGFYPDLGSLLTSINKSIVDRNSLNEDEKVRLLSGSSGETRGAVKFAEQIAERRSTVANETFTWARDPIARFSFDAGRNRVVLHRRHELRGVWINETLRKILGFGDDQLLDQSAEMFFGVHEPDLTAGIDTIYVYSDVCANQIVSNVRAPLLRVVAVPANIKYNERVMITFTSPHYVPCSSRSFAIILVKLCNVFGDILNFRKGETLIKLHFRPRRSLVL